MKDYDTGMSADEMFAKVDTGNQTEGTATLPVTETSTEGSPQPQPTPQMFKYKARGQEIEEPIDKILQRASMGYDYAQLTAQLKQDRASLDEERSKIRDIQRLAEIDEYARQNPAWKEHLERGWAERENVLNQNSQNTDPLMQKLSAFEQKIGRLDQFMTTYEAERQAKLREAQDQQLTSEIDSVKKDFPDIDLSQVDAGGKTLEFRILEHGTKNGMQSFKSAFRDYLHEDILKRTAAKAKEEALKELQKNRKDGLLGITQAPTKDQVPKGLKGLSYDEIGNQALDWWNKQQ